jgi:predicted dehydrogenase
MADDLTRRGFLKQAGQSALAAGVAAAVPLAPPDKQPEHLPIQGPPQKKLGFAIVGLGELALSEIMPAFALSERCRPVALVSGHPDKARKVAEHYGIDPRFIYGYDNYDDLRNNPQVDVVYVVLPNHMHAEYTIRALRAGKHVLCEKPMAATVKECQDMIAAAKGADRRLMIAYRLHYEPYNQRVIEMGRTHPYGPIRMISADNTQDVQAPNIRLSLATAGGPLGDVGVYCINAFRYITGEEPTEATGVAFRPDDDPRFREVPDRIVFTLRFPSGVLAHGSAGFSSASSRNYRVFCKDAWYGLDPAFDYTGLRLHLKEKYKREEVQLPEANHFTREMDHFAERIERNKEPATAGEEGLRDTLVMAAINRSIADGRAVKIADVGPDGSIVTGL